MKTGKLVKEKQKGFTLMELMIVVTLIILLGGITVHYTYSLLQRQIVQNQGRTFVVVLRDVQSRAIKGLGDSDWGIYIDEDHYIIFKGSSFNTGDPIYNYKISPAYAIIFEGSNIPGEIIFEKDSGSVTIEEDEEITLKFRDENVKINISKQGKIEIIDK